jgi:hypothetical protein
MYNYVAAMIVLWRIDPFLGRDLEKDEYSRCYAINGQISVSKQRSVNTFSRKRYPFCC